MSELRGAQIYYLKLLVEKDLEQRKVAPKRKYWRDQKMLIDFAEKTLEDLRG